MPDKQLRSLPVNRVVVEDDFWSGYQSLIRDVVIPYQGNVLEDKVEGVEKSHAIQNFRIAAGEAEGEFYGMVFQDSDVAKWLEAVAYSLAATPDEALEKHADEVIALVGRAQQPDGYLNTYFTVKEPEHRWQNLLECHELYCAGHMIEAAVAYYQATGKRQLLDTVCRNADLICSLFGREEGKRRGIPGHQEIELALLRLYDVTGKRQYLETAQYFLEERGKQPNFFAEEQKARDWKHWDMNPDDAEYCQNHAPVHDQDKATGHSVRAVYMYTAMADLAARTGNAEMKRACERLWANITRQRMYVTGGIGSTAAGEAFTADYDLPNDTVYAETCASVGMVFFARQMLEMQPKGEYADIMELELYNGMLSGMQRDGKRFFYVNPLEVVPGVSGVLPGHRHVLPQRPGWYGCACCPPNVARLIASLGQYAWGEGEDTVYAHTYLGGNAAFTLAGGLKVACKSAYPWRGEVEYTLHPHLQSAAFCFALHIPAWCGQFSLLINGQAAEYELKDGYAYVRREWCQGDTLCLRFAILPRRVYCSTLVRENLGCVALTKGPVVYCIEEEDNGGNLAALRLPRQAALHVAGSCDAAMGQVDLLKATGLRVEGDEALYRDGPPREELAELTAVPYYAWGNRQPGEMRVWIHE